jgi:hypothetical protein
MAISDEKPVAHHKFTEVKLDNGSHLMIPILVCEHEDLSAMRKDFEQDVRNMFDAVEKSDINGD